MAATDLFTVEVLPLAGLRRYFVFFVIELKTRRAPIAGIHQQPACGMNYRGFEFSDTTRLLLRAL